MIGVFVAFIMVVYGRTIYMSLPSKDDCSAKTSVHINNLLQVFTVFHYFGELIAIGMRQFMAGETVDSILVKEGTVEITYLFHSICLISQYWSCQHLMIPYTLKICDFLQLVLRFLSWKNSAWT